MARLARLYIPGMPQHLMLPTSPGEVAFRDEDDLRCFVETLRVAAREHGLAVHAYALTSGLVQILGTPRDAHSVARTVQAVGRRYVALYNRRHQRDGRLWEGRYRATVIDPDAHLLFVSVLIESTGDASVLQPAVPPALARVLSGVSRNVAVGALSRMSAATPALAPSNQAVQVTQAVQAAPAAQATSAMIADAGPRRASYAHHAGLAIDPVLTDHPLYWALGNTPFERQRRYRALAEQTLDATRCEAALEAAYKGWIFGDDAFKRQCERLSSRRVAPLQRGRPRKSCTSTAHTDSDASDH